MEKRLLVRAVLAVTLAGVPLASWWWSGRTQETEFSSSQLDEHPAELSIRPFDEPFSLPERGSSLFDKVFSRNNAQGLREYAVPYPFPRLIRRLEEAAGGIEPRITLFPMGRSLQRVAAIEGMADLKNLDPFFRFPRIVLGFDRESLNAEGRLNLNLKDRLYIGMNEKAGLLEVISYNDEAGRFEYQVVRDYEAGKKAQVHYANRQLCLTCHQNQTPIFSRAPWAESNANPAMQEGLLRVLRQAFAEKACDGSDPVFCVKQTENGLQHFYLGAPVRVDQEVPYALDQTTKSGNYFHAYHKMWQRICSDLECRKELLRQVFLYKLTGQTGLLQTASVQRFNQEIERRWRKEFPHGMKLPEAAIPNRDPLLHHRERGREDLSLIDGRQSHVKTDLEQVLSNSDVPGEFEPLHPRSPSELWTGPFVDQGSLSRLVHGYAQFFTASDARVIDEILARAPVDPSLIETLSSTCKFKRGGNAERPDFSISCAPSGATGIQFSTFVRVPPGSSELSGTSKLVRLFSAKASCDAAMVATPENLMSGRACPQAENVQTRIRRAGNGGWELSFQFLGGVSLRFLDSRRLAPVRLPELAPGEEKTLPTEIRIVADAGPLARALENAYQGGAFQKFAEGPALNRINIMTMVMGFMGRIPNEFLNLTREMSTLKKETEAPEDELGELPLKSSERAVALATRACGACHFNREGVPAAFLGGPQLTMNPFQKCVKVSACSARMLYRLKMWECDESEFQFKKTPMPPTSRMKAMNVDLEKWKRTDRVQLHQSLVSLLPHVEVIQILMRQGVPQAQAQAFLEDLRKPGCPQELSTLFEMLPRCDDSFPTSGSSCQ